MIDVIKIPLTESVYLLGLYILSLFNFIVNLCILSNMKNKEVKNVKHKKFNSCR